MTYGGNFELFTEISDLSFELFKAIAAGTPAGGQMGADFKQ